MENFKGEKIEVDNSIKKVLFYYDTENGIKQISSEVYKKIDRIIHYPRGFEGGPKYKTIKKFIFKGFKGKLPVGVIKSVKLGWGFTKTLYPLSYYLNDNLEIEEIIVEKNGKIDLDITNKKLYLNETCLATLQNVFNNLFKKHNDETDFILKVNLHTYFPKKFPTPTNKYIANALAISLAAWGNTIDEFSNEDKTAIKELFEKLSLGTDFLTKESLAKTKEIVDSKYIQATLKNFKELMALKTESENLEKDWQVFLRENSWIFSTIFAQPVILFKSEAYVGGKTIDNQNGKFNDFLIKNSLSDNVSFLEIKTHKTKMFENTPYRGEDVFCASKELTGCIVQVLNQRENFQKEFYTLRGKSVGKESFSTFNSKCVVLIGSSKNLDNNQIHSFELFRSNSRDVEILTFDELQTKIESLQKVMAEK